MANTVPWALSHTQVAVEVVATIAFALSGVIEGARKRLDAVGVCVVAGLAAFGGGTVRDILLDRRPLFWVQHAGWVWALLALCLGAMLFMRARHLEPTERAMQWPDALGLGFITMEELGRVEFWARATERVREHTPGLSDGPLRVAVVRELLAWQVTDLLQETANRLASSNVRTVEDVRAASGPLVAFPSKFQVLLVSASTNWKPGDEGRGEGESGRSAAARYRPVSVPPCPPFSPVYSVV